MKKICVLGITGSIGLNVADVVKQNPNDFQIIGVALYSKVDLLFDVLKEHKNVKFVYVGKEELVDEIKNNYPNITIFTGKEGIINLIDAYEYDMVVNSLVGFTGLEPTIHTLSKGIDCALANKESLVVGGELINEILSHNKCNLYPIDSEHVALSKCLRHKKESEIDCLILTASGGPFRNQKREELGNVTIEQALNHPSWKMGAKITIDSATMINKGFELIEAYYLFNIDIDRIHVLLHDESIIHSAVQMKDHSILADLGPADMRIPISYALYEENYHEINNIHYLDLADIQSLHFRKYDPNRYPGVELAKQAIKIGGSMPCVLNGANDAVNLAFREGKISFLSIEKIIKKVMDMHKLVKKPSLSDLIEINEWAYKKAMSFVEEGE